MFVTVNMITAVFVVCAGQLEWIHDCMQCIYLPTDQPTGSGSISEAL